MEAPQLAQARRASGAVIAFFKVVHVAGAVA
jgi:hypothetical protein